jgi:AcrR family transcriptional regulator
MSTESLIDAPNDTTGAVRRIDAKLRTRSRIRSEAVALFRDRGFDNVTTEQIAAAVGVTQRTLFRHFRTKDAILFDDDGLVELFDANLGRNLALHSPVEAIRRTLRDVSVVYDQHAGLFRALHEVIAQSSMLRAFARERTARIDDLIAWALDGEEVFLRRDGPPSLASRVAAASLMGAVRVITDEWLDGAINGSLDGLSARSWTATLEPTLAAALIDRTRRGATSTSSLGV